MFLFSPAKYTTNVPSKLSACAHMPCSFQKCFCTYFIHVVSNTDESWKNVAEKKFYAHTGFEKLEGALYTTYFSYYSTRVTFIGHPQHVFGHSLPVLQCYLALLVKCYHTIFQFPNLWQCGYKRYSNNRIKSQFLQLLNNMAPTSQLWRRH